MKKQDCETCICIGGFATCEEHAAVKLENPPCETCDIPMCNELIGWCENRNEWIRKNTDGYYDRSGILIKNCSMRETAQEVNYD